MAAHTHSPAARSRLAGAAPAAPILALNILTLNALALTAFAFAAAPASAAEATYNVALTGAAEAPTPGDPAAKGTAKINVDDSTGYLCYEITTEGLTKATMAHVHKGAKGAAGPPVVTLNTPLGGAAKACAKVDAVLAKAIMARPSDYYVNVHSEAFPAGAIRAQLGS